MGIEKGTRGPEYRCSREKNRRVNCHMCSQGLCSQNYDRHLRERHKEVLESKSGNLREAGEKTIS